MSSKYQTDFYFVLSVSPQAKKEEIKKAYLRLARIYHPDKNRGNKLAEKKFKQINEAWQILKDPGKRKLLDASLEEMKKIRQSRKKTAQSSEVSSSPQPESVNQEKPIDLEIPLKLSLEDICQSRTRKIHYFRLVNGKESKNLLKVQIPHGVRPGSRLRFKGEGGAEGKKVFGDLYIRIQLEEHELFRKTKFAGDLILECPISLVSAIQGGDLKIPSPYGFITIDLNPPLRHKQLLKVSGHGLPKGSKGDKGDLFVKILIDYPAKEGLKIQKQMQEMSLEQQKAYVEKFKNPSFVFPKVLKFQKKLSGLKKG